ncbi:diguanylate cyclase [Priestia aryabhattai]|uniref:Diguanylate cyclase n=1 Tax=Priestia aryabhattai TaxID=412384 RepID=A0ABD7X092_PRIAR|nr:diguanylate cyclase [Priestia aryabhattai]MBY0029114.1 diguanylate cyclase [Priestia aryabhattai]WEA45953.1 diguanylate cyclase [Priestia aryabhattai]HWL24132.1 diguanylate cyclase [Ureibacillus sp.]
MLFKATAQKTVVFSLLLLNTLLLIQSVQHKELVFLHLLAILCLFLSFFLRYEFQIDRDTLTYRIYILWFKVYAKTVKPRDIKRIVFKRLSWKTKLAIVQIENGWNMRVALFNPPNVFKELETFAHKYDVDIQKKADY